MHSFLSCVFVKIQREASDNVDSPAMLVSASQTQEQPGQQIPTELNPVDSSEKYSLFSEMEVQNHEKFYVKTYCDNRRNRYCISNPINHKPSAVHLLLLFTNLEMDT